MRDIIVTNQPSHSLKEEFKKWLEQQNYKPSVVRDYISKVLFDEVHDMLSGKKIGIQPPKYAGIPFAFRKLIKCAHCGCYITSEMHTKKSGKQYRYVRCSHMRGKCQQGVVI